MAKKLTIDFEHLNDWVEPILYAKQGDINRWIEVELLNDGNVLETADGTYSVSGKKPDGTVFSYSTSGKWIKVTEQMAAVAGDVKCEFTWVYGGSDAARIGSKTKTATFILRVMPSAVAGGHEGTSKTDIVLNGENFGYIDDGHGNLTLVKSTGSTDSDRILTINGIPVGADPEDLSKKTRIDFDGSNFKIGTEILNYKRLHDIHLLQPDFAFVVYGDRAYLLSYVQDDTSAMREMRFQSVIAVTDGGLSYTKTSGIYVKSSDGVSITNVSVTDINSENKSYKATEINDSTKNHNWYPSVKAVTDFVDGENSRLSESITEIGKVSESKDYTLNVGMWVNSETGAISSNANYRSTSRFKLSNNVKRIVIPFNSFYMTGIAGWGLFTSGTAPSTSTFVRGGRDYVVDLADNERGLYFACTLYDSTKSVTVLPLTFEYDNVGVRIVDNEKTSNYLTGVVSKKITPRFVSGIYINKEGNLTTGTAYKATEEYYEIPNGTTVIRTNCRTSEGGTDACAFYDSNKAFIDYFKVISNSLNGVRISNIPESAKYIRVTSRNSFEEVGVNRFISFENTNIQKADSLKGKKVVMLGDSIIGNYNSYDSIPYMLESLTGAKFYNCAFGGSSMGTDTVEPTELLEAFNGWKIINAICTNDYSLQLSAIAQDPSFSTLKRYFANHIQTLQNIDWNSVDIVTFSYGTNDWGTKVTLDNASSTYDTNTFTGGFRTAIETLLATYPHIKIVINGVIWRGVASSGNLITDTRTSKGNRNWYLYEYEEKAKEVALEYGIPFLPMFNDTNFNKFTWQKYFNGNDVTHPNDIGREIMAKRYAWFLKQI